MLKTFHGKVKTQQNVIIFKLLYNYISFLKKDKIIIL